MVLVYKFLTKLPCFEVWRGTTKAKVMSPYFHLYYTNHPLWKRLQRFPKTPLLPKILRGLQPQNLEKSHGTTKARRRAKGIWKTGTTNFGWVTPFCHKKWVCFNKIYNFYLEPQRQRGYEIEKPSIPHKTTFCFPTYTKQNAPMEN